MGDLVQLKATEPDKIKFTLIYTATLQEWESIRKAINAVDDRDEKAYDFAFAIYSMVEKAMDTFEPDSKAKTETQP